MPWDEDKKGDQVYRLTLEGTQLVYGMQIIFTPYCSLIMSAVACVTAMPCFPEIAGKPNSINQSLILLAVTHLSFFCSASFFPAELLA